MITEVVLRQVGISPAARSGLEHNTLGSYDLVPGTYFVFHFLSAL